jgi:hypothetical protein
VPEKTAVHGGEKMLFYRRPGNKVSSTATACRKASHRTAGYDILSRRTDDLTPCSRRQTRRKMATAWTRRRMVFLSVLVLMVAVITFGVTTLLVSIFERRQEARQLFESSANRSTTAVKPRPGRTG